MRPKYVVMNKLTGYICFNGRRFWTSKGAVRKIRRSPFSSFMVVHRIL